MLPVTVSSFGYFNLYDITIVVYKSGGFDDHYPPTTRYFGKGRQSTHYEDSGRISSKLSLCTVWKD